MANLVIVESPSKANTIKGYLGSNYKVIASKGHIRDLPKSTLGIDIENGFEPHYINIRGKGDTIKELKREAKNAKKVFLATDPDREGEAIAWHIANQLNIPLDTECRITFNETTKNAVKEAIKHPCKINEDLVNSQQARRILDRIVGFSLSEILWKKVKSGLSGGRVQSVATRIITEREEEIRAFVPQEYWTIEASLQASDGERLNARFYGDRNSKIKITNLEEAALIESKISVGKFKVFSVKHVEKPKNPAPPFTTSTLQQEASKRLGFNTQKTMKIAQELYEGVNLGNEFGGFQGLITYMRTDSLRISETAQRAATEFIIENYGKEALPSAPKKYKSNANSQDAHEAIRPADVNIQPKHIRKLLTSDQYKLYNLIWERFVASQMAPAVMDTISIDFENSGYIFKTGGYIIKSRGYMNLYESAEDEETEEENISMAKLPSVRADELLLTASVAKHQHFTEPPPRYTEASLVKFFEENGIARPSTYATIISTIIARNYVKRDGKLLVATELGEATTDFMRDNFSDIVDYEFTAYMESQLDSIENRDNTVYGVISKFYEKFVRDLNMAAHNEKTYLVVPQLEKSDTFCDKCGAVMVYKNGRFGKFLACSNFPKCRNTRNVNENATDKFFDKNNEATELKCELCGSEMVLRQGRYGAFCACKNYPRCNFTKQKNTALDAKCPKCSSRILVRHARGNVSFYSCEKYPECDFSSWDMPLSELCPKCNELLYYRKSRKTVFCKKKDCGYKREDEIKVIE